MNCRTSQLLRITGTMMVVAVLLVGAVSGQKVKVDYDHATDFSKFRTYAWTDGTPSPNPVWDQVIQITFSSELEAKGLKRVEAKDADLLVAYHAASDTDLNVALTFQAVINYPSGGLWYAGPMGGSARYIKKGTLAVHLFDRQKQQLVWSATAQDPVKETPKKKVDQLNKAADKMFSDFPPKPDPKP